ncbi:MAG TPA: hypothetical protein V6D17_21660 [Candidatus Obscuribacterales bacterium]
MTDSAREKQTESRQRRIFSNILAGYSVIGLLMLCMVDAALHVSDRLFHCFNPYDSPNHSLVWWAVEAFKKEPNAPDLVLLGSSLMMVAHHAGDATHLNKPQNEVFHFHSSCLQDELERRLKRRISTFSFAVAGQMASDAYLIASRLLTGDNKPKAIVYGIAPRDLVDNTLPGPSSTETYRYLSRIADTSDVALMSHRSFFELLDLAVKRTSFVYSHRDNFLAWQHRLARSLTGRQMPENEFAINCPWMLRKLALAQFPEDNGTNELMIAPYGLHKEPYKDNSQEYKMRYACIKERTYKTQLAFLEKLMNFCRQEGIELFLVNMPLTPDNRALMPAGFYESYMNKLRRLSSGYSAHFIDLNNADAFPKVAFADSVHLNGLGGVTFFRLLAGELSHDSTIASQGQRTNQ